MKSQYKSALGPAIIACLDFREQCGFARATYESNLRRLDRFYAENYPGLDTTTKEAVLDWIANTGQHSKLHDCIAVRHMGEYLQSIGKNAYVLSADLVPRSQRMTPYIFTDAELLALFHAIDTMPERKRGDRVFERKALPVLFRLLYTCGLRPSEGRLLERDSVNLTTGEILIKHNKQHKERIVVMSDDMLVCLQQYIQLLEWYMPKARFVFPYKADTPYSLERLTRLFRECWFRAHSQEQSAALPRVRLYDLRHRYASAILCRWLDEGADILARLPYLRAYMGHEQISATAYYIHLLPENLTHSKGIDWKALDNILPEVE